MPDDAIKSSVFPKNYALKITTPTTNTQAYTGNVYITLSLNPPTKNIKINASKQVKFNAKSVWFQIGSRKIGAVNVSRSEDTVEILFGEKICEGVLQIDFTGKIGNATKEGFFKSPLENTLEAAEESESDDSEDEEESDESSSEFQREFILATHFQPTSARMAFPCFDNPGLKATFDITITTLATQNAVSNMPMKSKTAKGKQMIWQFETSPKMSCYLVAWAVGNLASIHTRSKSNKVISVFHRHGNENLARFALDVAVNSVNYLEIFLGVDLGVPKLDLFPIPVFDEAMENWGLILFEEDSLMVEVKNNTCTDPDHAILVANLIAHEIVHHWFGNLVTMEWWSDLWLNEGFADLLQFDAVDCAQPNWGIKHYVFEMAHTVAFRADETSFSRPLVVSVDDDEAEDMFDDISYKKGASVVQMFRNWIATNEDPNKSTDIWKNMLKNYLVMNAYGSVESKSFYAAIDGIDASKTISTALRGWVEHAGFPIVSVDESGTVTQEKFTLWKTGTARQKWSVPVTYTYVSDSLIESQVFRVLLHPEESPSISLDKSRVLLVNPNRNGYYLFQPTLPHLSSLLSLIVTNPLIFMPSDRAGLIYDSICLMLSNRLSPSAALPVLNILVNERHPTVWRVGIEAIGKISRVLSHLPEVYKHWKIFVNRLVSKTASEIGFFQQTEMNDDFNVTSLRCIVLPLAAAVDHKNTVSSCLNVFDKWAQKSRLDTSMWPYLERHHNVMLETIYDTCIRVKGDEALKLIRNPNLDFPGSTERERLLPMGASQKPNDWKTLVQFKEYDSWVECVEKVLCVSDCLVNNEGELARVEVCWNSIRHGSGKGKKNSDWEYLDVMDDNFEMVEYLASLVKFKGTFYQQIKKLIQKESDSSVSESLGRGLERAEAAHNFRVTHQNEVLAWLLSQE